MPPDDGATAPVGVPDHLARDAHGKPRAEPLRRRPDDGPLRWRQVGYGPLGRVFSGPRRDLVIGLPLLAEEAENGGQGRQADSPVAEPGGVQPGLVEFQPGRQQVRDPLVKARHEQSSDTRLNHF